MHHQMGREEAGTDRGLRPRGAQGEGPGSGLGPGQDPGQVQAEGGRNSVSEGLDGIRGRREGHQAEPLGGCRRRPQLLDRSLCPEELLPPHPGNRLTLD